MLSIACGFYSKLFSVQFPENIWSERKGWKKVEKELFWETLNFETQEHYFCALQKYMYDDTKGRVAFPLASQPRFPTDASPQ